MAAVQVGVLVDARLDEVWQVLADFTGISQWASTIAASEADAAEGLAPVRRLTLPDGRVVRERLVAIDVDARSIAYDFLGEAPFPVRHFVASVQVLPVTESGTSYVLWRATFSADDAVEAKMARAFTGLFSGFGRDLRTHLGIAGQTA